MTTYSFLEVNAALVGPGGAINLGQGAAASEEGISIDPTSPINTMTIAADGTPMQCLGADKSGVVTVTLLKTSPTNAKLSAMYALQTASPASHGQNTLTVALTHLGDVITCQQVAFQKAPSLKYAKEGGTNDWVFDAGIIDRTLGGLI